MKKNNIFKVIMMAVIGVLTMSFVSCDDDDDAPVNALKLSNTMITIAPKATSTVTIGAGTAPFTVKSSNEKSVTATVNDKTVTITGVAEGSAIVKVTDKNNLTGQVAVTVKKPMNADQTSVEVAVGKTVDVAMSNGNAPYAATVKDTKIASATVKDSKVTIKGVKAGKTTVTVADKNKSTVTINVTVK